MHYKIVRVKKENGEDLISNLSNFGYSELLRSYRISNFLAYFRFSSCCSGACDDDGGVGGGDGGDGGDGGGGGGGGGDGDACGGCHYAYIWLMHGFQREGQMQRALRLQLLQQQLRLLRRFCLNFA